MICDIFFIADSIITYLNGRQIPQQMFLFLSLDWGGDEKLSVIEVRFILIKSISPISIPKVVILTKVSYSICSMELMNMACSVTVYLAMVVVGLWPRVK